jgi:hypothetical protein
MHSANNHIEILQVKSFISRKAYQRITSSGLLDMLARDVPSCVEAGIHGLRSRKSSPLAKIKA